MAKSFLIFSLSIWIISCGGGSSSTISPTTTPTENQPTTITFKSVPENIGIFN